MSAFYVVVGVLNIIQSLVIVSVCVLGLLALYIYSKKKNFKKGGKN